MSTPLLPNDEQVAVAWIKAALGITNVATSLPDPPWTDDQFVQVMQVGGSPDIDVPMFHPVVSLNAFAMKPGSLKPPWGQAHHLVMRVLMATYATARQPAGRVELDLPDNYGRAIVCSVYPVSQPRKIPSDPSQYAVYNLDLNMTWYPASVVVV